MNGVKIILACGLLLLPSLLYGQNGAGALSGTAEVGARGLETPVDAETYVLGPGDSLLVSLTGLASYVYPTAVTPEGKLFLMMPVTRLSIGTQTDMREPIYQPVAQVRVSGMTIADAQAEANQVALKYFRNTEVLLTLMAFRKLRVAVVGDVLQPGVYTATPVTRVSEVISISGLQGTASRATIELVRGDSVHSTLNLYDFELTGDPAGNPYVMDGDIIRVPSMRKRVTVRGAVFGSGVYMLRTSELTAEQTRTSEGIYELEDGDRVTDVVRKAGGVAPWADLASSYIERHRTVNESMTRIYIDLERILVLGESSSDIIMIDGDILVVPSLEDVVYVEGAVTVPGAVTWKPGLGVMGYVGLAGGPTDRASMGSIKVRRKNGETVSAENDMDIGPGDTILVPTVTFKWWQDHLTIVSAATSVLIAWLTLTR